MQLQSDVLANGITLVTLAGRLDIAGTREIEPRFTALTSAKKAAVVVDLSAVDFISSIGIRTLLASARAQAGRGGKLVVLAPQPAVKGVMETAGISSLLGVFEARSDAERAVGSAL